MIGKVQLGSLAKGILDYCQYERIDKAAKSIKATKATTEVEVRGEVVFCQGLITKKALHGGLDTSFLAEQINREASGGKVKKFIWHQSFSLPPGQEVSNDTIASMCEDFCSHFGFGENQVIAFRHRDKAHPHFHIIANRIAGGKCTASDANNFLETGRLSRKLEEKYGLTLGLAMHRDRLDGKKGLAAGAVEGKASEQLRILIDSVLVSEHCKSLADLKKQVEGAGYRVYLKATGISFTEKQRGISFKGSDLGRGYSKANLEKKLLGTYQSPVVYDTRINRPSESLSWLSALRVALDQSVPRVTNWADLDKALSVHGFGLRVLSSNAIQYTHLAFGKVSTVLAGFGQERTAFCENYGLTLLKKSIADFHTLQPKATTDTLVAHLHGQGFLVLAGVGTGADTETETPIFKVGVLSVPIAKTDLVPVVVPQSLVLGLKERCKLTYYLDKALAIHAKAYFKSSDTETERSIPKALERLNQLLEPVEVVLRNEKGLFYIADKNLGLKAETSELGLCFDPGVLSKRLFEDNLGPKLQQEFLGQHNLLGLYQIRLAIDQCLLTSKDFSVFRSALLTKGITVLASDAGEGKTENIYRLGNNDFKGKHLGLAYQDYNLQQRLGKDAGFNRVFVQTLASVHQVEKCLDRVLLVANDFENLKSNLLKQGYEMKADGIGNSLGETLVWKQLSPLYQEPLLRASLGKSFEERLSVYQLLAKKRQEMTTFKELLRATLHQQLPLVAGIEDLTSALLGVNILLKKDTKGGFIYENILAKENKGLDLKGYQLGENGIFNDKPLLASIGKERSRFVASYTCFEHFKVLVNQARVQWPSGTDTVDFKAFLANFNLQHEGHFQLKFKEDFNKVTLVYEAIYEHEGKRFKATRGEGLMGSAFKATFLEENLGLDEEMIAQKNEAIGLVKALIDVYAVQTRHLAPIEKVLLSHGVEVKFAVDGSLFMMKIDLARLKNEVSVGQSKTINVRQAESLGEAYYGFGLSNRLGKSKETIAMEQTLIVKLKEALDRAIPHQQNWFTLAEAVKEVGFEIVSLKDKATGIAKAVYWHKASNLSFSAIALGGLYQDYHIEKRFGLEKSVYQDFLYFKQSLKKSIEECLPKVSNLAELLMSLEEQGFKPSMVETNQKLVPCFEHESSQKKINLLELSSLYSSRALERSFGVARESVMGQLQFEIKLKRALDGLLPQVSTLNEVKYLLKTVFEIEMKTDEQGKFCYLSNDGTGFICKGEDLGARYEDRSIQKELGRDRADLLDTGVERALLRGIFVGIQIIVPQNDQYKIMKSLQETLDVSMKKQQSIGRGRGMGF